MADLPVDAEGIVRSIFEVKESFALPDGELEFQVTYGEGAKEKFVELRDRLAPLGFRPELTGSREECVLLLRKAETAPGRLSRLPVFFALFTIAALVVYALVQQEVYEELVPSWPYYLTFLAFGASVALLLGSHELGQRLMSRVRRAGHASIYVIPALPFIPPFLPSLGFVTAQRDPALNRDNLFDTVVAGPLAMFAVAALVFALGDLTAVQSTVTLASTNLTTVTIYPNAIQLAISTLLNPFIQPIAAGYVAVSPLADGSFIGFVLVFLSLLPMASYDGGVLAAVAWGPRRARAASYLSILALLVIDTWTYWAIAVIALLLVGRPYQLKLQDEVSPLSVSRRWLLAGAIVLAFLCLPIPGNIATFPLP